MNKKNFNKFCNLSINHRETTNAAFEMPKKNLVSIPKSLSRAKAKRSTLNWQRKTRKSDVDESNFSQKKFRQQNLTIFFNLPFDKKKVSDLINWSFSKYGEKKTVDLVEKLKSIGYSYATSAGISLGIDDLKIPAKKRDFVRVAEQQLHETKQNFSTNNIDERTLSMLSRRSANLAKVKLLFPSNFTS